MKIHQTGFLRHQFSRLTQSKSICPARPGQEQPKSFLTISYFIGKTWSKSFPLVASRYICFLLVRLPLEEKHLSREVTQVPTRRMETFLRRAVSSLAFSPDVGFIVAKITANQKQPKENVITLLTKRFTDDISLQKSNFQWQMYLYVCIKVALHHPLI